MKWHHCVLALAFTACTTGQPAGPANATAPTNRAADLVSSSEKAMLDAEFLSVRSEIRATGAVEANVKVWLDIHGDKIRFYAYGTFAGKDLHVSYLSNGKHTNINQPPVPGAGEASVIGLMRMGLLHNVAWLMKKRAPDHAEGGVREWVQADNIQLAQDQAGNAADRTPVRFDIVVAGKKSGVATVLIDERTRLPASRTQTVQFPTGTMNVTETYRITTTDATRSKTNPLDEKPFMTRQRCGLNLPCLTLICSYTDARACTWAGLARDHGLGTARDTKHATILYKKACVEGDPDGCRFARAKGGARRNRLRRGVYGDTARRAHQVMCRYDRTRSCEYLARQLPAGAEKDAANEKVKRLLKAQCPDKPASCYRLAQLVDRAAAYLLLQKACAANHERSCRRVYEMTDDQKLKRNLHIGGCDRGWGGGSDCLHAGRAATPDKKLSFFEKGCSQGSAASCVEAANILEKSAKTRARAIELLGKACAGSTADEVGAKLCDRYWAAAKQARLLRKPTTAKVVHDRMCRLRMRVPSCLWMAKRSTKPFAAYSIACEAKHAPSCWKAARAARKDPDNKEEEAKAYERGCALGDPIACWKAGKLVKACASGKGSYDACLAKAAKVTNFESHEGDFTGDRDNWCRLACKAWRKRDRRERRASGKNPKRTKVCRKVKRCR